MNNNGFQKLLQYAGYIFSGILLIIVILGVWNYIRHHF